MLTDDERQYVIAQFTNYLAAIGNVRATAVVGLPAPLQARVPDGATPAVLAQHVVEIALADGWSMAPPVLVSVLDSFKAVDPKLAELRGRIASTAPPSTPDPLLARVLDTRSPFLDRAPLRRTLRDFARTNSRAQVLVVNGPPKSGRSYTKELLFHFCRAPAITLCCVARSSWTEPQDLAADLVASMGGDSRDLPAPTDTNKERWLSQLANWVLFKAAEARTRMQSNYWFLLDGFGDNPSEPLRFFITQLAERITNGYYASNDFRLILIEFRRSDLTVSIGKIVTDDTAPLPDQDLAAEVQAIVSTNGALPAGRHQDCLRLLIQGLPADDRRLQVLNERLRALIDLDADPAPGADPFVRFEERLRTIPAPDLDEQDAVAAAHRILRESGQVPESAYPAFVGQVLQDLPAGGERAAVLRQRLETLAEALS